MPLTLFAMIVLSVTLSAVAQIAFKFGVSTANLSAQASLGMLAVFLTPWVMVGLGLYFISMMLWLNALSRVELSQAYPFVGFGFGLTTLAGWWLFGDSISAQRLIGIVLISGGVVLLARS